MKIFIEGKKCVINKQAANTYEKGAVAGVMLQVSVDCNKNKFWVTLTDAGHWVLTLMKMRNGYFMPAESFISDTHGIDVQVTK